jgi:GMP synthase (glutamine-hydrolysing)
VRVLAFRHVPFEGLGLIEPALESRGVAFDYADLYRDGAELPDAAGYDGLIFLGGPMSANEPLPYLNSEMRVMERAIAAGIPVLGVCLGAQLIAKTLGAPVYRNATQEIGWFPIHLTEAAEADPVFAGLHPVETVFHWHSDTFDLPAGAELLARSGDARELSALPDPRVNRNRLDQVSRLVFGQWCDLLQPGAR